MGSVLEGIAICCLKHLREGGYISADETEPVLAAYLRGLAAGNTSSDFICFAAEDQARKHSLTVEGEIVRMQRVLRGNLRERVHYWTFGPMPGRASSLYDLYPRLRAACEALGCPTVIAGEPSVMHVSSINPVAALVATSWITHEIGQEADIDAPFVFPFLVDLTTWNMQLQRHFAA
jgi:hypothetical protein